MDCNKFTKFTDDVRRGCSFHCPICGRVHWVSGRSIQPRGGQIPRESPGSPFETGNTYGQNGDSIPREYLGGPLVGGGGHKGYTAIRGGELRLLKPMMGQRQGCACPVYVPTSSVLNSHCVDLLLCLSHPLSHSVLTSLFITSIIPRSFIAY